MFGNSLTGEGRIYSYKCDEPHEGLELIRQQLWLSHRYKNRLIELERARRDAVHAALVAFRPEYEMALQDAERLEGEVEAMTLAMKAANAAARKRVATKEQKEELAARKAEKKAAWAVVKEVKREAFEDEAVAAQLKQIDAADLNERKAARAASNLYWGNYLRVEQSMGGARSGAPPAFRRWDGQGAIAVQIQGGLPWVDAMNADGAGRLLRVRVEPPRSRRDERSPQAVARFRIGSDGRKPIWGAVRFKLDPVPPADTKVKWVYLRRDRVGVRAVWSLQLVLERESWEKPGRADGGIAGIDVGWRQVSGGLRVAYLVGGDGHEEALIIPRDWLSGWRQARELQSVRDTNFDTMRDGLAAWLDGRHGDLPEWLHEATAHLRLWKSKGRLAGVVWTWHESRFDGDAEMFAALEAWRKQDRHLFDWAAALVRKRIRRRDDLYRKFAHRIACRYYCARIEDTNWKELSENPDAGDEPNIPAAAKANARIAAVGRLLGMIGEAVAEVQRRPASRTTITCHLCGTVDRFDAAKGIWHTCSQCGARWDQDRNAAINLLASEPEVVAEPG